MSRMFNDYDGQEGNARVVTFAAVGPIARGFINDQTFISSIMGPYGSAKTTSCFQKIINCVLWQNPGKDGVRRIRVCVIRATYAQLQTNVMADWFSWFPKTGNNWNGEQMKHSVVIDFPGVGRCVIEMLFRALGDLKAEEVFKGMALTLLWLNEVDTLDAQVLKFGLPRVGRYPFAKDGGCAWSGVIADFNAPDVDNWVYDLFVNKNLDIPEELMATLREIYGPLFGINFHKQPGGRTPEAENLANLPPGYYDRLLMAMNDNEKRRFVDNEFGAVNNGQPVFPEYRDDFHCAKEFLPFIPGLPVHLGVDGGMTPAITFGQLTDEGVIRVIAELVIFAVNERAEVKQLAKLGPTSFGKEARAFADRMFPRATIGNVWGDPAAFDGGEGEDLPWAQTFGKAFGKKVKAAPVKGNRLTPRLEAVRGCIADPEGRPKLGLIISPTCKHLRRGFNNGYVIQRVKFSDGSGRSKDEPNKNDYSHVHDALQYLVVGLTKRGNPSEDMDKQQRNKREMLRRSKNINHGNGYFSGRRAA